MRPKICKKSVFSLWRTPVNHYTCILVNEQVQIIVVFTSILYITNELEYEAYIFLEFLVDFMFLRRKNGTIRQFGKWVIFTNSARSHGQRRDMVVHLSEFSILYSL